MTLVPVEVIALISAGFVCGISVGFGFVLQALRKLFSARWSGRAEATWIVAMVTSMVFITLAPVFLMAYLVFGSDPDGPSFWPRMLCFALGILLGTSFAFGSAVLFNRGYRSGIGSDA